MKEKSRLTRSKTFLNSRGNGWTRGAGVSPSHRDRDTWVGSREPGGSDRRWTMDRRTRNRRTWCSIHERMWKGLTQSWTSNRPSPRRKGERRRRKSGIEGIRVGNQWDAQGNSWEHQREHMSDSFGHRRNEGMRKARYASGWIDACPCLAPCTRGRLSGACMV